RRMNQTEHVTHSAAVFVTINKKPVRASKADALFFVAWIDNILKNIAVAGKWNHYFTHDLPAVQERYLHARNIYKAIASESYNE
ncbi:MAG: hypothetical protein ABI687_05280, partial [Flavitalea sp.]